MASIAVEQERVKVYQTRSRAREQAERKKREAQQTARKAQEEAERELSDAEEKAERGLLEKQHELELAKVELQAWQENGEKDRNNVLAQAISQPKALIGKTPFDADTSYSSNVKLTTINAYNLVQKGIANKMVSTSVPVSTVPYNTL